MPDYAANPARVLLQMVATLATMAAAAATAPADGGETAPAGGGETAPAGGGETAPAGEGETAPAGEGETAPVGSGEAGPAAAATQEPTQEPDFNDDTMPAQEPASVWATGGAMDRKKGKYHANRFCASLTRRSNSYAQEAFVKDLPASIQPCLMCSVP